MDSLPAHNHLDSKTILLPMRESIKHLKQYSQSRGYRLNSYDSGWGIYDYECLIESSIPLGMIGMMLLTEEPNRPYLNKVKVDYFNIEGNPQEATTLFLKFVTDWYQNIMADRQQQLMAQLESSSPSGLLDSSPSTVEKPVALNEVAPQAQQHRKLLESSRLTFTDDEIKDTVQGTNENNDDVVVPTSASRVISDANNAAINEQRRRREFLYHVYRDSQHRNSGQGGSWPVNFAETQLVYQAMGHNWGAMSNANAAPLLFYHLEQGNVSVSTPYPDGGVDKKALSAPMWQRGDLMAVFPQQIYITPKGMEVVESDRELWDCVVWGDLLDWSMATTTPSKTPTAYPGRSYHLYGIWRTLEEVCDLFKWQWNSIERDDGYYEMRAGPIGGQYAHTVILYNETLGHLTIHGWKVAARSLGLSGHERNMAALFYDLLLRRLDEVELNYSDNRETWNLDFVHRMSENADELQIANPSALLPASEGDISPSSDQNAIERKVYEMPGTVLIPFEEPITLRFVVNMSQVGFLRWLDTRQPGGIIKHDNDFSGWVFGVKEELESESFSLATVVQRYWKPQPTDLVTGGTVLIGPTVFAALPYSDGKINVTAVCANVLFRPWFDRLLVIIFEEFETSRDWLVGETSDAENRRLLPKLAAVCEQWRQMEAEDSVTEVKTRTPADLAPIEVDPTALGIRAKKLGIRPNRLARWDKIRLNHFPNGLTQARIAEIEDVSVVAIRNDFRDMRKRGLLPRVDKKSTP